MSSPWPEELAFLFLLGKRNGHGLEKTCFPGGKLDCWPENKAVLPESPSLHELWELCSTGRPNGNFKLVICLHFTSISPCQCYPMSRVDCFRGDVKLICPYLTWSFILTQVNDKVCLDAIGKGFTINFIFSSVSPAFRHCVRFHSIYDPS